MDSTTTEIPITRFGPEAGGNYESEWSGGNVEAYLISDVGKKREHNEDSCILCTPEDKQLSERRGLTLAIADGMGGASAGEYASHLALKTLIHHYYTSEGDNIPELLQQSIEEANLQIFRKAEDDPDYYGMGTTASSVSLIGDCVYVSHVGDSRVYLLRDKSELLQVTKDHSLVAEQVRNGMITEEEARSHSLKNLITRAVGIKDTVQVDLVSTKVNKGDTLLLCSDGLTGMVGDATIRDALTMDSIKAAARVLVGRAIESGGTDNVTIGILRIRSQPEKTTMQSGCEEIRRANGWVRRLKNLFA